MRLKGAILLALALILGPSLWAGEPLSPISFRGGVDYLNLCSEIEDWRACDSSNMYGDRVGSADTRNGSDRLNSTAVSTNPFSSLFSATIATGTRRYNVLLGVSGDTIYFSTDDTFTRWLPLFKGLYTPNQHFSFAVARNEIYMSGDALTDPIFRWDVAGSSFGAAFLAPSSTYTAYITAKYLLYEKGYLLAANVKEGREGFLNANTTYYDDRIYYSYLLTPSSFTVDRLLNINLGDGDYITGLTSKRTGLQGVSMIMAYKTKSAYGITFKILNPAGENGDQDVTRMADGFGHISDRPPENIGAWDVILSRDGLILWNGGLISRSSLSAEKILISMRIKPVIDRLVRRNSYRNAYIKYYAKSNYLVFAYEDPDLFPQGRINSIMFYDLATEEWWPMKNPIAASMDTDKGPESTGKLLYGDAMDGYVHILDDPVYGDDSRREISIDPMETTEGWRNAGISSTTVAVGTASLSLSLSGAMNPRTSSITKVAVLPLGEWYDKNSSSSTDKISFKVFPSSRGFISIIRIDLEVRDVVNGHFDTNFSSVVISSAALTAGSSAWTTVEIPLSSFTILDRWVNLQTEELPFARNSTRFGIRFVSTATQGTNLYFDDIRFVAASKTPLNPYRLSKRFNLGTMTTKDFTQVVLTRDKPRDSSFKIDVLAGQGVLKNTVQVSRDTPQQIYVCGFKSTTGIASLDSVTLEETGGGTKTQATSAFAYDNGASDSRFIYSYDTTNDRLVKIERSSPTVFVSSYGSLGSGTSNFNYVQEFGVETESDGNILIMDHMNHRIKEHRKKGLTFVRQYGQLGFGATSFYNPTGLDWDSNSIWVCDDSNQAIKKFSRNYAFETMALLDINTIGNCTLKVAPPYMFVAYNRGSNDAVYLIDVVLEKRQMSDLSLISRITVRPEGVVASSTYSLRGSLALHSKFVTIAFNENSLFGSPYYLQKRLQSDLSLVKEVKLNESISGVIGDNLQREISYGTDKLDLSSLPDIWMQLRFYARGELENSFKLSNMGIVADKLNYIP